MLSNAQQSTNAPQIAIDGQELKKRRHHHIARAIRLGAFVLIGQGVMWCLIFGFSNVPIGVALHACFVACGFALLYFLTIGAWKILLHMTFWILFFYCIGILLFFDMGLTVAWPKVTHLYLLPIILGVNLIFMDERPIWRIVYGAICIFAFVIVERRIIAIPTLIVSPNGEQIAAFAAPFNTFVALVLIFISLRRFADDVEVREDQLNAANSSIESLLEHMLPLKILKRLREEKTTFAEEHNHVSILFSDIVGFTQFAAQTEPQKLVSLLNEIFSRFDQLVELHGVEKIKTIGDAYMAVSGIPDPRPDHALALARLAKDMLKVIQDYPGLNMRIGINSGHVIAGIIGRKRFIYDLWGDAVNVAASMESHGTPSRIHVTEATSKELRDYFELEFNCVLNINSAVPMRTFFIGAEKNSDHPAY